MIIYPCTVNEVQIQIQWSLEFNSVDSGIPMQWSLKFQSMDWGCENSPEWSLDKIGQHGGTLCLRAGPVSLVSPPCSTAQSHTVRSCPEQLSLMGKAVSLSLGDLHLWKIFISIHVCFHLEICFLTGIWPFKISKTFNIMTSQWLPQALIAWRLHHCKQWNHTWYIVILIILNYSFL